MILDPSFPFSFSPFTVISLNETGASHLHASGSASPQHRTVADDDYTIMANVNVTVGVVGRITGGNVSTQAGCESACTAAAGCTKWSWSHRSAEYACFLSNGTNWAGVRAANVTSGCLPWVDECGDPPNPLRRRHRRRRRLQPMPGDKGVVNPKDGNSVLIDDDGVGYIAYTAMAPWGTQPPPGGPHPPGFTGDHMVAIERLTPDLRRSTKACWLDSPFGVGLARGGGGAPCSALILAHNIVARVRHTRASTPRADCHLFRNLFLAPPSSRSKWASSSPTTLWKASCSLSEWGCTTSSTHLAAVPAAAAPVRWSIAHQASVDHGCVKHGT